MGWFVAVVVVGWWLIEMGVAEYHARLFIGSGMVPQVARDSAVDARAQGRRWLGVLLEPVRRGWLAFGSAR